MFLYNLKIAFRSILKTRQSYFLNVLGLVFALVVCYLTFFYVSFEHRFVDIRYKTKNVFLVEKKYKAWDWIDNDLKQNIADFIENEIPSVECVIRYANTGDFNIEVSPQRVFKERQFHFVDSNYMKYHKFLLLKGQLQLKSARDLLITKDIALKYFGTIDCIGKELLVHGHKNKSQYFTVVGVFSYSAPAKSWDEYNLIGKYDAFELLHRDFNSKNKSQECRAEIILGEGANTNDVEQQIIEYYREHNNSNFFDNYEIALLPLKTQILKKEIFKMRTAVIISIFILLIALINFVIHNNARFWEQSKLVGVKKVAGGKSGQIILHYFFESLIVTSISALVAFSSSIYLLPHVNDLMDDRMEVNCLPFGLIVICSLLLILIVSVLTIISSFVLIKSFQPAQLVKKAVRHNQSGKYLNSGLIVVQVSIFSFLLILFLTSTRQIKYAQNKDWGIKTEQVIQVSFYDAISTERYNDFKNRIQQISGVENYTACSHVPPDYSQWFWGNIDENNNLEYVERNVVDYGYIETLGIDLIEGRSFDENLDKPGSEKIMVNQEYLKLNNITHPLDTMIKMLSWSKEYCQIIGVIDDYHMRGMDSKINPLVLQLLPGEIKTMLLKINPENSMVTLAAIEKSYKEVFPQKEYKMSYIDDNMQKLYKKQLKSNTLYKYYTIISIIITIMGLFSFVMSQMNKRIKEIGIRKVNGATKFELFYSLNKEFLILVLLAYVFVVPVAYYFAEKWAERFVYRAKTEWWIFLLVGAIVCVICILTISFQTLRVAKQNPVKALKYE